MKAPNKMKFFVLIFGFLMPWQGIAADTSSKAEALQPKATATKPKALATKPKAKAIDATKPKALSKKQKAAALRKKDKAFVKFQNRFLLEPYNRMNGYTEAAQIKYVGQIIQLVRQLSPSHQRNLELVDIGTGKCHKKGGKSCNLVLYSSDKCHLPSIESKNTCQPRSSVYNFSSRGSMAPMSHWEKLRVDLTGICKHGKLKANDKLACEKLAQLKPEKPTLKDIKHFGKKPKDAGKAVKK